MTGRIAFLSPLIALSIAVSVRAQHFGPAQVEVEPVVFREVAPTIRLVGTLFPRRRVVVAADVAGLVEMMPVDYGDTVRKGDPVCVLRDAPRRWAMEEAKARVASIEGELAARRAEVQKTAFELDRMRRLARLKQSSDMERVTAESNHAAASARVRQSEAVLDEVRAALANAEDALARTRIVAPFDAIVTAKLTEVGQWTVVGGPIVEMVDLAVVRARVMVPESAIVHCLPGEAAMVTVDALGRDFGGVVSRVVRDADIQANTFPVEIDIPNRDGLLMAGMFIRAMVPAGPKAMRLLVPKDALVRQGGATLIYVVRSGEEGHMAAIAPVTIVAEVMRYVAVESPAIHAGDLAIVRGNEKLRGPGPVVVVSRHDRVLEKKAHRSSESPDTAGGKRPEPTTDVPQAATSASRGTDSGNGQP